MSRCSSGKVRSLYISTDASVRPWKELLIQQHVSLCLLTGLFTHSLTHSLTHSMEQSPSWEANRFSASQEIPRILWNPKVHYRIHKCPPPLAVSWARSIQPMPSHPTSWRSILKLTSHLRLGLTSSLFLSGFPTETLYSLSLLCQCAICTYIGHGLQLPLRLDDNWPRCVGHTQVKQGATPTASIWPG